MSDVPMSPSWPIQEAVDKLFSYDDESLLGRDRLGALAYERAPALVGQLKQVLADLALENWTELPDAVQEQTVGQLKGLLSVLEEMSVLSAEQPDAGSTKEAHDTALTEYSQWFKSNLRPYIRRADFDRWLAEQGPVAAESKEIQDVRRQLDVLESQRAEIQHAIEQMAPVVEAGREAVSESGVADLGKAYSERADIHHTSWLVWGKILGGVIFLALLGGVGTIVLAHPEDSATNAQIAHAIALDLLVVGLLVFVVRVAAQQFRVQRHLSIVSENKAAALATFNRMVAGQPEEVRSVVAAALAQAIFTSEQTGLTDGSSDHVTMVERVMAPIVQRPPAV